MLQERLPHVANGPVLPRAGFFDPPDRQQLPPLPSLDDSSSRRSSTGKAGMHIRNMLNDEPEEEGATTPARDDWFGTDGGDAASVSTEDDPEAAVAAAQPSQSLLSRYDERALDAMRPASAPQAIETVRAPLNGLPSLFRTAQRLPSFPSSLSERRLDGQPRMPAFAGQQPPQWTRSPASPFTSFVASPAPTASPLTPAQSSGDYYRRATFETARTVPGTPDYFTPKPAYERYARSVDSAGSTPALVPYGQPQQQHSSQQQQQQQRSASTYPPPPPSHSHPHPHPHSHHHHAHPSPQWSHDPSRR